MLFVGCFLVAQAAFWFRRNAFRFYIDAQPYLDKMHGLCRYIQFSVGKYPAKTLSLFIPTKWIISIFSANQEAVFLRIQQIVAQ